MSPNKPISRRDTGFPNRMAGTNNRHPDAKVLTAPWEPEDPDAIFRQRLVSRGGTTALRPKTSYLPSPPTTAIRSLPNTTTATSSTLTNPNRSPSLGTSPPGSSGSNATFPSFPGTASTPPVPVPRPHVVPGPRAISAEDSSSKERSDSFGSTSSAGTMVSTDSAASLASKISASERSGWGAWAARIGEWNQKRKERRNASFRRQ